ncbi:MAG: DnaJ family molecular chaperone [Hyphomicrobiaceae bacterium]
MFERTRIDNMSQSQSVAIPAELTLDDMSVLKGDLMMPATRPVHEVLNGPGVFVEFRPYGKEPQLLAKSAIRGICFIKAQTTGQLSRTINEKENFDPFRTLGLSRSASHADVHKAYVTLAKTYHPDRFANADLPNEVRDYLAAKARQINLAFQALDTTNREVVRRARPENQPIYASTPV